MPTIIGRLTGAAFQTELLVMNLLGLVSPRESVLCWVVKIRIIIAGVYTITYCANFYSILTWCRERTLLPWIFVSALDNFLLEFIEFAITLLLWVEKSLSTALLIEYVIARTIPRVPALYYWCIINLFRADLRENQRRKLILASLSAHQDIVRNLDISEHLRFGGVSYSKDYFEKSPRFTSLTNLDDLLLHSAFEYDDGQDSYKRSKSLVTFLSIDSVQSDELEDYRILKIFDNYTLTPMEKAMKILDLNEDDINETRVRLGKNVLPGPSKIEKIDKVISTVERSIAYILPTRLDRNVSSVAPKNTIEEETVEKITMNKGTLSEADMNIEKVEPKNETREKNEKHRPLTKIPSIDENLSRDTSKNSSRNPLSGCICGHKIDEIIESKNSEPNQTVQEPANETRPYEKDDDDSSSANDITEVGRFEGTTKNEVNDMEFKNLSKNRLAQSNVSDEAEHFPRWSATDEPIILPTLQMNPHQSLSPYRFRGDEMSWLKENLAYPEDLERRHYELFRLDDITRETSEPWEENSDDIVSDSSMNFADRTDSNFNENTEIYENNVATDVNDFPAESSFDSTPMERTFKNSWKNIAKHNKKWPEIPIDREASNAPILHFSKTVNPDPTTKTDTPLCRFAKRKKRLEKIEEREAREMRALRVYNRLTLLEDKREMEAKKRKDSFPRRTGLQTLIRSPNVTDQVVGDFREFSKSSANEKKECANNHGKFENIRKRQNPARPQNEISKLSAFNVNLDALKTSISLSFSNDNKNHSKLKSIRNSLNQTLSRINREIAKESCKYSEPTTFNVGENVLSPSVTKIEELWKGRNVERTKRIGNRTIDSCPMGNRKKRENVFPRITLASIDSAEIEDENYAGIENSNNTVRLRNKRGISRIREAFMNVNWSYNDRSSDNNDETLSEETADPNSENFLWDIIDETNTITLLQSAFSSNPENTSRGFYLGPGSTELYSISNYFSDVIEEIMKTTRLIPRSNVFPNQPTTEIDYGHAYLEEFKMTSISTIEASSEDTLTDSDTESIDSIPGRVNRLITSDPINMCLNNHSVEGFDVQTDPPINNENVQDNNITDKREFNWDNDCKEWQLEDENTKNIIDIFGEQELSHLEFWTRELTKLASNDHRDDSLEFSKHIQHLTKLPGFFVVQMVVDFFRNFIAVSRSTMTSRIFLTENGTEFSSSNAEIVTSQSNETSDNSFVDETASDPRNVISTNDVNSQQFYFGSADNERSLVTEMLDLISGPTNELLNDGIDDKTTFSSKIEGEIIPHKIQVYPIINQQQFPLTERTDDSQNLSLIMESSSQEDNENTAPKDVKSHLTFDSYDSLYSVPGNSNDLDNIISIDGRSSMEEFPRDTTNSTEFHDETLNATLNP